MELVTKNISTHMGPSQKLVHQGVTYLQRRNRYCFTLPAASCYETVVKIIIKKSFKKRFLHVILLLLCMLSKYDKNKKQKKICSSHWHSFLGNILTHWKATFFKATIHEQNLYKFWEKTLKRDQSMLFENYIKRWRKHRVWKFVKQLRPVVSKLMMKFKYTRQTNFYTHACRWEITHMHVLFWGPISVAQLTCSLSHPSWCQSITSIHKLFLVHNKLGSSLHKDTAVYSFPCKFFVIHSIWFEFASTTVQRLGCPSLNQSETNKVWFLTLCINLRYITFRARLMFSAHLPSLFARHVALFMVVRDSFR